MMAPLQSVLICSNFNTNQLVTKQLLYNYGILLDNKNIDQLLKYILKVLMLSCLLFLLLIKVVSRIFVNGLNLYKKLLQLGTFWLFLLGI